MVELDFYKNTQNSFNENTKRSNTKRQTSEGQGEDRKEKETGDRCL